MNVSDFFWKRMSEWGICRVFGYLGDGIKRGVRRLGHCL